MVQRYKFESKSQRFIAVIFGLAVVFNGPKIQIWKQITTRLWKLNDFSMLFSMVQRYKFESKSQPLNPPCTNKSCCFQWSKDTNLKANHNAMDYPKKRKELFSMVQRYKFESKSQRMPRLSLYFGVVFNGPKIQIWKQITTVHDSIRLKITLFSMVQRYKFESKSQRLPINLRSEWVVFNGPKIQIWKQITTKSKYLHDRI